MKEPNKFTERPLKGQYEDYIKICPVNEFRILTSSQYPTDLPEDLTKKFNQAVMAVSASNSSVVCVINGIRVDKKELDEHPFVIAFDLENKKSFAGFIDHGNWEGRTTPISKEMKMHIDASGSNKYFPLKHMPQSSSGTLDDLFKTSQSASFVAIVEVLKKHDPDPKY